MALSGDDFEKILALKFIKEYLDKCNVLEDTTFGKSHYKLFQKDCKYNTEIVYFKKLFYI